MSVIPRHPDPFPSTPSGEQLYGASNVPDAQQSGSEATLEGRTRVCSVRGCGTVLMSDYARKMCEACRGRHRTYASTKRAKRKMEKAALRAQRGQTVAWMPLDGGVDGAQVIEGPRLMAEASASIDANAELYQFPAPAPWDESAIDPALITHDGDDVHNSHGADPAHISHDYEIARALRPPSPMSESPPDVPQDAFAQKPSADNGTGPNVSPDPSTVIQDLDGAVLPPRFCSIKGCKALVPGNSLYKMCEPCRDRYRNYGTTKRERWKRRKTVIGNTLQPLRDEENRRRAEQGLPPLTMPMLEEWRKWQGDQKAVQDANHSVPIQLPTRLCSVSHCREILSGEYPFLRCEKHRIQNRYHSKLKRSRDKAAKAQAFDGWNALVNGRLVYDMSQEDTTTEEVEGVDGSVPPDTSAAGTDQEWERERSREGSANASGSISAAPGPALSGAGTPFGEPGAGVPPAARGTRRTNHVCSIKACHNLLAPTNPWKMCDLCRERDRIGRRDKALRDSGIVTTPLPRASRKTKGSVPTKEVDGGEGGDEADAAPKPQKKKKKTKKVTTSVNREVQSEAIPSGSGNLPLERTEQVGNVDQSPPSAAGQASNTSSEPPPNPGLPAVSTNAQPRLVFMSPLVPEPTSEAPTLPPTSVSSNPSPIQSASSAKSADPFRLVSADEFTNVDASDPSPLSKKKAAKRKKTSKPDVVTTAAADSATNVEVVTNGPVAEPPTTDHNTSTAVVTEVHANPASSSGSTPQVVVPPPPATCDAPLSNAVVQPPYMPYYVPSYGMTPYGAQASPYAFSSYSYPRPPYGSNPMYQPPYPTYHQPYGYPQPYTQPYASQPYASPPSTQPTYSVSSDFVSRAEYASHSAASSVSSAMHPSTYYSTFSAKTGEAHSRVAAWPSHMRRKRVAELIEASVNEPNKRQAVAAEKDVPIAVVATTAAASESDASRSTDASEPDSASIPTKVVCSNKTCHRPLPANTSGTLCARCKERIKKRQVKAKQRFRLEPRKLLGRIPMNPLEGPNDTDGGAQTASSEGLVPAVA